MTYLVDAWLEREDPRLKVVDKRTGQVLVDLDAPRVRALLESGEFSVRDFQGAEAELQEIVRALFLRVARERVVQGCQR